MINRYLSQPPNRVLHHMKTVVQRFPVVAKWMQSAYRVIQPRFTVGAVGVLLNENDEVLLVEHVFHPKHPWGLPGGWVDVNELPSIAVEREFFEEMGLEVQVVLPLEIWSNRFWFNHLDMAFLVQHQGSFPAELTLSAELADYQWFPRNQLPQLLPDHYRVIDLALRYQSFTYPIETKEVRP